jgi:hypothetical protein
MAKQKQSVESRLIALLALARKQAFKEGAASVKQQNKSAAASDTKPARGKPGPKPGSRRRAQVTTRIVAEAALEKPKRTRSKQAA